MSSLWDHVKHHEKTRSSMINPEQPTSEWVLMLRKHKKWERAPRKRNGKLAYNINIHAHFFPVLCRKYIYEYK